MTETEHYLETLEQLKSRLGKLQDKQDCGDINLFTAVGMTTQEIKHSAFLAWLLNSSKNPPHMLGNAVLEKMCGRLYDYPLNQNANQSVLSNQEILRRATGFTQKEKFLALIDGEAEAKIEVTTEEDKRIDILINIPKTQTVIVIENKMFTLSHDNQLVNYQKFIENPLSGYSTYHNKIFIYLSPKGEVPINYGGDEEYNELWCIFDYKNIECVVSELLRELRDKDKYPQLSGSKRTKLKMITEDYIEMIKTNILRENPTLMEECKSILADKKMREAFELLTLYSQTATEDKVLSFVRQYLGAVEDGAKSQRWFYTLPMKEFFERQGEKINNRLCRCVCQPIGAMGGIVGFDIVISLEKQNGAWTGAQKKILSKVLPDKDWQNKTFSGPANTRIVLLTGNERGQLFEDIKPGLEAQLQKFKIILNNFEKQLTEIE